MVYINKYVFIYTHTHVYTHTHLLFFLWVVEKIFPNLIFINDQEKFVYMYINR